MAETIKRNWTRGEIGVRIIRTPPFATIGVAGHEYRAGILFQKSCYVTPGEAAAAQDVAVGAVRLALWQYIHAGLGEELQAVLDHILLARAHTDPVRLAGVILADAEQRIKALMNHLQTGD